MTRTVSYRGYLVRVPAGWPVFRLAAHPRVCARFDRHAVYLGRPGPDELCPSQAAGRTEAILIQPLGGEGAARALPPVSLAAADAPQGTEAQIVNRRDRLLITATWNRDPGMVARALGMRSLAAARAASTVAPPRVPLRPAVRHAPGARLARAASIPGEAYTGQAFDACSAPSSSQMSAWSSAYRAIGVYIGGANMGCSQSNLTSGWVSRESAAGWHLIPIYVGLQAPQNECGCAAISTGRAAGQGRAAAQDAVAQAQAIGLGAGNPIYYDMEGYAIGPSSSTVLSFLSAWTQQLHAAGYTSGVYSSDDSGIHDLVSRYGTGYAEPDEIWAASWNGQANTTDAHIPGGDWADHQRLHQYAGNEDQTHGGVTINIDSDYVDGATAAAGSATTTRAFGSYWLFTGYGNVYTSAGAGWYGSPRAQAVQTFIVGMAPTPDRKGYWLTDSSGRVFPYGGAARLSMSPALSLAHPIVGIAAAPSGGYWLYTAYGNVYTSSGTAWYGSPAAARSGDSLITGMAVTRDGRGYWLVDSTGRVFAYGDAASQSSPPPAPPHPIIGITASRSGGYWAYTAYGNIYPGAGASWLGSPYSAHAGESEITGMASTADGQGYWLVDSSGAVLHYGDAASLSPSPALPAAHPPITGIVG